MRKVLLCIGLMCCLFILGCASGRRPEPVLSYMPGDQGMSCEELRIEMAKVKQEIMIKRTKIKERNLRNGELFVTGIGLLYPWGEMDNLKAEEVEISALMSRYNNLFMIAAEKSCPLGNNTITVRAKGGRAVTVNDFLDDKLPPNANILSALSQ